MLRFLFAALLVLALSCPARADTTVTTDAVSAEQALLGAPQDLRPFAETLGPDTLLLSPQEQAIRNARSDALFFGPWQLSRPTVSAKSFRESLLKKARGFHLDTPWTQPEWNALHRLANAAGYPAPQGPAIITRHTDMRAMPTGRPLLLEATPAPAMDFFDFFQHASLPLGTPVYISHASTDAQWLYVEYPLLSGWVRAADVARVAREFIRAYATGSYGVVVQDKLALTSETGDTVGCAHMGSVFPLQADGRIVVPRRNPDGTARMEALLPAKETVLPKPLPLTPGNLARLGNRMLGQPYRWGGSDQMRDCSLATRDLFLPFGLWLPRNSRSQVNTGTYKKLAHLSPQARKAAVLRDGKPFMTLLGFPGHVGLYVGALNGEPIMLHNILGLRTSNADEFFRHIIGKCNLSTLEVGKDNPRIQLSESLLERLQSMRHLQ